MESGDIKKVSRVLTAIGDKKAQIAVLLEPVGHHWPIFFEAVRYGNTPVVKMLLGSFKEHPKALIKAFLSGDEGMGGGKKFSFLCYALSMTPSSAYDSRRIERSVLLAKRNLGAWRPNTPENVLDLLLDTAYATGIFSNNPDQPYPTDNNPGDYPPNTTPFLNAEAAKESLKSEIAKARVRICPFSGFSLIRTAGKHFGAKFEAECLKDKRQAIEFDE
jgi:hypothetical protein